MKSKNDFLKKEKLEELLIANWISFLDTTRLLAFVLQEVKNNTNNLAIITGHDIKAKGNKVTISKFSWDGPYFIIWLEFTCLIQNKQAEGTMEVNMYPNGEFRHIQTFGTLNS